MEQWDKRVDELLRRWMPEPTEQCKILRSLVADGFEVCHEHDSVHGLPYHEVIVSVHNGREGFYCWDPLLIAEIEFEKVEFLVVSKDGTDDPDLDLVGPSEDVLESFVETFPCKSPLAFSREGFYDWVIQLRDRKAQNEAPIETENN